MTCSNYSTPSRKDKASTSTYLRDLREVNKLPVAGVPGALAALAELDLGNTA
jgi:hypothetical protein